MKPPKPLISWIENSKKLNGIPRSFLLGHVVQTSLKPYKDKGLFSTHYLEERLKDSDEWREEENAKAAFEEIKGIYEEKKDRIRTYTDNEAQLERDFIRPILEALGQVFGVQATIQENAKRPDYGFFGSEEDLSKAFKNKDSTDFYERAVAVGDAKAWDKNLDKKTGGKDIFENHNPSYQIDFYLRSTEPDWGILTNGRKWRLYFEESPQPIGTYYEVDLVSILEENDFEKFKFFYLFFRSEAFKPVGESFLDRVYDQSLKYSQEIGENLEENVYNALLWMAKGYFNMGTNNLEKTEENVKLVHENSLIFLYRLLFLFYAESKGMLGTEVPHKYASDYSFARWVEDILNDIDRNNVGAKGGLYNTRLRSIFDLVDKGSEELGIPKEEFHIPAYNGGLFDKEKHSFLREKKIQDGHIARVVDLLARVSSEEHKRSGRIDYSDLSIRHLGGIYEGLLEYKPKLADKDMVAAKKNGALKWIPASKSGKDFSEFEESKRVKENELYLATDKGERKATGSYYTPDYIVKHIVKNTVGPVMEEKLEDAETKEEKRKVILETKILDPAMGSGHFLVESVDFLANELVKYIEVEEEGRRDIDWAKRKVARNCIYGVDVNPLATELAKVSLWLNTMAEDKPLSFLDHHLKTGNSLIGADLHELDHHPEEEKYDRSGLYGKSFQDNIRDLIEILRDIGDITEENPEDIEEQEQLLQKFESHPFKKKFDVLADVQTSYHFGNEFPKKEYHKLLDDFRVEDLDDIVWEKLSQQDWVKKATNSVPDKREDNLSEEKKFFHWKLEFPEVFFEIEKGTEKENSGFDAVIGNPPYVKIQNIRSQSLEFADYLEKNYKTSTERFDLYSVFVERGIKYAKNGRLSYILPNKFFESRAGKGLRRFLSKNSLIDKIIDFGQHQIFPSGTNYTCILSTQSSSNKFKYGRAMEKPDSLEDLEKLNFSESEISSLNDESWILVNPSERNILNKMKEAGKNVKEFTEGISEGIVTGDNPVFFVDIIEEKNKTTKIKCQEDGEVYEIESELVHPLVRGDTTSRYKTLSRKEGVIYPYKLRDNSTIPIDEKELQKKYPKTYSYLSKVHDRLANRGSQSMNYPKWYSLWCPREKELFESPKILTPDVAERCEFTIDENGVFYYADTVYGIIPKNRKQSYLYTLLGALNSKMTWFYIKNTSSILRGGFRRFKTSYISPIPLPNFEESNIQTDDKAEFTDFSELTEGQIEKTRELETLNLNISDYLGNYEEGKNLENLYIPSPGVADTVLANTKADRNNLKLGQVEFEDNDGELILKTSAKFKPENEEEFDNLDKWGYAETELIPAMRFSGSEGELALIREFTKLAVDEAGGFANFREKATKTKSLIDRLEKLTLPKLEDVESGLKKYLEQKERAERLEDEIQDTDNFIDAIVFDLYDLNKEEVTTVLDSLDTEEEVKQDILERFSRLE